MLGYSFSLNDKSENNLKELSTKQSLLFERRMCEIKEIASSFVDGVISLCSDGLSYGEALSVLSGSFTTAYNESHSEALVESLSSIGKFLATLSVMDKAIFVNFTVHRLVELNKELSEKDFLDTGELTEQFVYVKNPLADEAYDVFSQEFKDPRVRYAQSFKDAIKTLDSGEVSYCLLPLEEKNGVRIGSVSQLIFSEDLKINSVTPVFGIDGAADMKYALVSKSFTVPKVRAEDDRYLEIRLGADDSLFLSELMTVADFYQHSIYRINTVSFEEYGEARNYYTTVIHDEGRDFIRLLVYLILFSKDSTPVGIYKNLE